jgi:hypothetical protein
MSTEVGWCAFCGGGDRWIKTCRAPDGSRIRVCDPCWEAHTSELVIVPGDHLVTARCDRCGGYGNPRDFAGLRAGGRRGAYSGACRECTQDAREAVGEAARALRAAILLKEGGRR